MKESIHISSVGLRSGIYFTKVFKPFKQEPKKAFSSHFVLVLFVSDMKREGLKEFSRQEGAK